MEGSKKQLISGTIYFAIAKYSGVFINIGIIAALARMISPEDFDIVAITTVLSNFFTLFSDFGIASAIIQKDNLTHKDLNNIFSYSVYFSIIIGSIFFFSAYIFANVYKSVILASVIKLLSIQVFFATLNVVPNALLLKAKRFKFISLRTIIIQVICGIAAIACAFWGFGVYAVLVQPILSAVFLYIINYINVPRLSLIIRPDLISLKKVLGYSLFSLGYNIVNYFSRNLDKLIVGKYLSFQELGYYEKSYSLMMMPVQNVLAVVNPVIQPVLSRYQNDEEYIFRYFSNLSKLFAWIGFPLAVFLYAYSDLIVTILLGDNWLPAVPVFKFFALSIGFQLIYTLQGPFFLVRNAPNYMLYCGIITMALIGLSYFITTVFTFHILLKLFFPQCSQRTFWKGLVWPFMMSFSYFMCIILLNILCEGVLPQHISFAIPTLIIVWVACRKIISIFKLTR